MTEMQSLSEATEKLARTFEDFKKSNDDRLAQIEKKGSADALTSEQVDRINGEITRLEKEWKSRADDLEKKANRPSGSGAMLSQDQIEHKQKFGAFLRRGHDAGLREIEKKAVTAGSDPEGGYFVPEELEANIDRVLTKTVAMRRLATTRTIGTSRYVKPVVTSGAASGGWGGETAAPSETGTPGIAELAFVPGKLWAEPRATSDVLEDAYFDLEGWLGDEVNLIFEEKEDDAYINGSGINQPKGFLSETMIANASYAWGKIGHIVSGAAADFAAANPSDALIDTIHALKSGYRGNATWLLNDATLAKIRKFKSGQGDYLWVPGLQQGAVGVLMGYPVETSDHMPDVGAGAFPVAFGDFKRGYLIVDRRGIALLRDPYTAKPYIKFYISKRVGGGVQNFEAIKLLKIST